jgi:hypothetical protein
MLWLKEWTGNRGRALPVWQQERAHQKRHPAFSTRPTRHWLYSNDVSDDQFFS